MSLAMDTEVYSYASGQEARKKKQTKPSRKKNLILALDEADKLVDKSCLDILENYSAFYENLHGTDGRRNLSESFVRRSSDRKGEVERMRRHERMVRLEREGRSESSERV